MAKEKRLIAYDPIAFGEFLQSLKNTLEVYDPYSDGYEDGVERIEDWLEFNAVLDAVEVVHGRWTYTDGEYEIYMICSECGWDSDFRTNYCPNCGAKMDLEDRKNATD